MYIYTCDPNLVITVPADGLTCGSARPADTVLSIKLHVFYDISLVISAFQSLFITRGCHFEWVMRCQEIWQHFWVLTWKAGGSNNFITPQPKLGIVIIRRAGRRAGGRDHSTVTALTGAALIRSRSNLEGTNLGAGPRTSSFLGDVAR